MIPSLVQRLATGIVCAIALVAVVACAEDDEPVLMNSQILTEIPWSGPETATYFITQGDVEGTGVLQLAEENGVLVLSQDFTVPEEEITDNVEVRADPDTLRPQSVSRTIDGPDGQRLCDATYSENSVTVEQVGEDGERTDVLDVPDRHYDTWADLFLWRTLDFRLGLKVSYRDTLSCSLEKPGVITVGLEVKEIDTIEVPAGEFEVWLLEIKSGGDTQKAWYSTDDSHLLVRYENGLQEFQLESFDLSS